MGSERGLLFLLAAGFLINTTGGSLSKHASNQQQIIQTRNYDYEPTWESLDARPLPNWYDQGKIGIFVHWGVYSVPAFSSEWFWYHWLNGNNPAIAEFMERNYRPGFSYQDFGVQFTAEFYNATRWAQLFKKAGASYVVLTSKHHEGYALWPSKYSFSWNSVDVGSHRNLLGELAEAVRSETDLRFGLYHSLFEWYNPLFLEDEKTNYTSDVYVRFKSLPAMYELVHEYQPDIFWSDGEWGGPDGYWQSKEFLAWLYNDSPVRDIVVTNDRWGAGTICHHGGFYTCADRYNPGVLQPHKWENVFTIDKKSWGHRKDAPIEEHLTADEMIQTIVETVACGGNAMINVGPTKEYIQLYQFKRSDSSNLASG